MKCKGFYKSESGNGANAFVYEINEWLKTEPYIQIDKIKAIGYRKNFILIFYYDRKDKLKNLELDK